MIFYFGQPLTGRFFWKDFLIAASQLQFNFNISGFAPRFIGWRFVDAFIYTDTLNSRTRFANVHDGD